MITYSVVAGTVIVTVVKCCSSAFDQSLAIMELETLYMFENVMQACVL